MLKAFIAPQKETNMSVNYGSKRTVVGAHYGLRDWLSQRVTAALMVLFTVVVLVQLVFQRAPSVTTCGPAFSAQWMKVLTFSVIVASPGTPGSACVTSSWTTSSPWACVCPAVFTIVWLVSCAGWASRFCGVSDSRD